MLPPRTQARTPLCGQPGCYLHFDRYSDGDFHECAFLAIPTPGDVRGAVYVRWDDDEVDAFWSRHCDGRWTHGLDLPADPPMWLVSAVEAAQRLMAAYAPRELVSA
jgi:hypothetical protein